MSTTSSHIVTHCAAVSSPAQDRHTFAEVVHQTQVTLLALAEKLLGDQGRAEDVVQEVLLKAWASFSPGSNLGNLARRLKQLVIEHCQKEQRSGSVQVEYAGLHLPTVTQVGGVFGEELPLEQELIALAMESLPDELRVPLALHYHQGLSLRATQRELKVGNRELKVRLAVAKRALRRSVRDLVGQGVPLSARLAA